MCWSEIIDLKIRHIWNYKFFNDQKIKIYSLFQWLSELFSLILLPASVVLTENFEEELEFIIESNFKPRCEGFLSSLTQSAKIFQIKKKFKKKNR